MDYCSHDILNGLLTGVLLAVLAGHFFASRGSFLMGLLHWSSHEFLGIHSFQAFAYGNHQ